MVGMRFTRFLTHETETECVVGSRFTRYLTHETECVVGSRFTRFLTHEIAFNSGLNQSSGFMSDTSGKRVKRERVKNSV